MEITTAAPAVMMMMMMTKMKSLYPAAAVRPISAPGLPGLLDALNRYFWLASCPSCPSHPFVSYSLLHVIAGLYDQLRAMTAATACS